MTIPEGIIERLHARRMPASTDHPDALCLMAAEEIERLRELTENNAHSWDTIVRERNALRAALTELLADLDDPELIEISAATISRARQALSAGEQT